MIRVSFQGERGAYSEGAARAFFGDNILTVPRPSFAQALEAAVSGETDHAILPVENSIEGSVGESYDLLHLTPLSVTGEIYHRIEHCLIGTGTLEGVETVYSHPQALGQCRSFLLRNGMKTVPSYDTAGSVGMVRGMNLSSAACIASRNASEIYGVPVILEGIADEPENFTRFLVLSQRPAVGGGACKTSIIFSVRHEPGTLYRILGRFHRYGVNMTKIESRPKRGMQWEYNFFVDFEGRQEGAILDMLEEIREDSAFLKVLGTYPAAG